MAVNLFSQLPPPPLYDARLFGGLAVEPEDARSILRPQRDQHFGYGFALSPYRGCGHGCQYCYVREYPNTIHGLEEWGRWSAPKLNAPELLWRERHRIHNQSVFLSTATDPYQPLEREFRLTRACLEVLLMCPTTRVLVHTRSPLILQDLALLKSFGDRLTIGFSVPTDDDTVRQVVEPKAPAIPSRWAAIERLTEAGLRVYLAVTPLMVMVDPQSFARRAKQSGVSSAWVGGLRLLKDDPFFGLLERHGWLRALDQDYQAEIRESLLKEFPGQRSGKRKPKADACPTRGKTLKRTPQRQAPPIPKQPSWALQPGLFDQI